jgi:Cft2 family RNA processing exonuclease
VAKRPRAAAPVAPVKWRDGVHLTGTSIWCDARRRRDVCFVSSADRVVPADHGQLIGTPTTIALVAGKNSGHLAVPVHRPFTLGTLRLELIPSGRAIGAAALHVDTGARTVLYAGAIRTAGGVEPAEVRASDAVIVDAPIGEHVLGAVDDVADRVVTWVRTQLAAGKPTVLVVDSALDGLEIATKLAAAGLAISASKSVRDAAAVLRKAGVNNAAFDPAVELRLPTKKPTAVVIRAESDRVVPLTHVMETVAALVSPRAVEPDEDLDIGFVWPFVASRDQLLAWIEQSRAKQVYVTGAYAETIVAKLGKRASVLGPPQQMALFSS